MRRLKNIICFLEWIPSSDPDLLKPLEQTNTLTIQQRERLREVFALYDWNHKGTLCGQELRQFFKSLDLDSEGDTVLSNLGSDSLSLEQIEAEVTSQGFYQMQQGRHYVALSLEEAEHLRAAMHLMGPHNWPSRTGVALRCIGNLESVINTSLIEAYGPVLTSAKLGYQLEVAEQLLRFTNCAPGFETRELNILLRSLQQTLVADRLPWWLALRQCRRRAQIPHLQLPFAKVFLQANEFEDLATKALLSRLRWALAGLRLSPADAFMRLDTDDNGALTEIELTKGLEWLGLDSITASASWAGRVNSLFNFMNKDGSGSVSREDFKEALELDEFDWESVPSASRRTIFAATYASEPERVLAGTAKPFTPLTAEECKWRSSGRFKLVWQDHTFLEEVWGTRGTLAQKRLSIWEPTRLRMRAMTLVKERICLGHFVQHGFSQPEYVKILSVIDNDESGLFSARDRDKLDSFVDRFFPHPVRYRQVWAQQSVNVSSTSMHVLKPIPPSEVYVAVGVVTTTDDKEPALHRVRCVPRRWVQRVVKDDVKLFWTNAGTGGSAASFWTRTRDGPTLFDVTAGSAAQTLISPELLSISDANTGEIFYADLPLPEQSKASVVVVGQPVQAELLSEAAQPELPGDMVQPDLPPEDAQVELPPDVN